MPAYENVHRGQSAASQRTTALFEESYDTIAAWVNAPSRRCIATYRNTTEAINAVMYSLLTEFRDGDNVVTHDDGAQLQLRALVRAVPGDPAPVRAARWSAGSRGSTTPPGDSTSTTSPSWSTSGPSWSLSPAPRTSSAPSRRSTASGGSPTAAATGSRTASAGRCCSSTPRSSCPSTVVDVQALDVDYLAFSFHKMLAPFGVGVLYGQGAPARAGRCRSSTAAT